MYFWQRDHRRQTIFMWSCIVAAIVTVTGAVAFVVGEERMSRLNPPYNGACLADVSLAAFQGHENWGRFWLVFDDAPLGEVVTQLNRYNHEQIEFESKSLCNVPISGEFSAIRPDAFVEFLQGQKIASFTRSPRGFLLRDPQVAESGTPSAPRSNRR